MSTAPYEGPYPATYMRNKAKSTLDFLAVSESPPMVVESYGISSDIERAHVLAQVMQEIAVILL